ncbi:hypothetical protein [Nostoc sp. GT001]|uniref:hypothetical protein n=1 Tax=Nostoc sp. GT001 TaxID=3056647 RepID=UPI0025AB56E6|nr:hypothetical protein [Nostoc sp. GT001]MDM9583066.1 hypothetical protein [Nostoc sp. GT001]
MTIEIPLDTDTYLNIIAGKQVLISPEIIAIAQGQRCKLVNSLTKTYMFYRLQTVVGDYGYWVK